MCIICRCRTKSCSKVSCRYRPRGGRFSSHRWFSRESAGRYFSASRVQRNSRCCSSRRETILLTLSPYTCLLCFVFFFTRELSEIEAIGLYGGDTKDEFWLQWAVNCLLNWWVNLCKSQRNMKIKRSVLMIIGRMASMVSLEERCKQLLTIWPVISYYARASHLILPIILDSWCGLQLLSLNVSLAEDLILPRY